MGGECTLRPRGGLLLDVASGRAFWLFERLSPALERPKPKGRGVRTPAAYKKGFNFPNDGAPSLISSWHHNSPGGAHWKGLHHVVPCH